MQANIEKKTPRVQILMRSFMNMTMLGTTHKPGELLGPEREQFRLQSLQASPVHSIFPLEMEPQKDFSIGNVMHFRACKVNKAQDN